MSRRLLAYLLALLCPLAVYLWYRQVRRGIVLHLLGIVFVMGGYFTLTDPRFIGIYWLSLAVGLWAIFFAYAITVIDCIKIIKRKRV